jgi:hypothetical protein
LALVAKLLNWNDLSQVETAYERAAELVGQLEHAKELDLRRRLRHVGQPSTSRSASDDKLEQEAKAARSNAASVLPLVCDQFDAAASVLRRKVLTFRERGGFRRFPGLEREDLRTCLEYARELAPGSRAPELEQLIIRRFPPEGREQRIRRALAVLGRLRVPFSLKKDQWQEISEIDLYEE